MTPAGRDAGGHSVSVILSSYNRPNALRVPIENRVVIAVAGLMTTDQYALQGESVQGHMPRRADNVDASNAWCFRHQLSPRRRQARHERLPAPSYPQHHSHEKEKPARVADTSRKLKYLLHGPPLKDRASPSLQDAPRSFLSASETIFSAILASQELRSALRACSWTAVHGARQLQDSGRESVDKALSQA